MALSPRLNTCVLICAQGVLGAWGLRQLFSGDHRMPRSFCFRLLSFALFYALTLPVGSVARPSNSPGRDDDEGHRRDRHVFVIVLENEGFEVTFGPNSKAPFLAKTLTSQGVLLSQYFATGHVSLDNYIAMLSGQAATPQTRLDCI